MLMALESADHDTSCLKSGIWRTCRWLDIGYSAIELPSLVSRIR